LIYEGFISLKVYSKVETRVMGIDIPLGVQGERWDHMKEDMGASNWNKEALKHVFYK
jgi:hypothetical protein